MKAHRILIRLLRVIGQTLCFQGDFRSQDCINRTDNMYPHQRLERCTYLMGGQTGRVILHSETGRYHWTQRNHA